MGSYYSEPHNHRELWGPQSGNPDCVIVHFCSSGLSWVSDPLGTHTHLVPTPVPTSCLLRGPGTQAGTCLCKALRHMRHIASSPYLPPAFCSLQPPQAPQTFYRPTPSKRDLLCIPSLSKFKEEEERGEEEEEEEEGEAEGKGL